MKQLQTICKKNRLAHAYIFEGEKGTGKREVMHFFVKLLLCENPQKMFHVKHVEIVRRVKFRKSPKYSSNMIRMDNLLKLIKFDDLVAEMKMTGLEDGRKVYVIHHADQLNAHLLICY